MFIYFIPNNVIDELENIEKYEDNSKIIESKSANKVSTIIFIFVTDIILTQLEIYNS